MQWFISKLISAFRKLSPSQHDGYTLLGRLEGHSGAINCLSFTRDGTLLASGADDEAVRIWDVETLVCVQIIRDSAQKWGQITSVNWLSGDGDRNGNALCFGTGRGLIVTFRRSGNMIDMTETGTTKAFMSGDSVEATAFDPVFKRVLASSHYGVIRMYSFGPNDHLTVLWESTALFKNEVPRALFLTDKGNDAIILGLEEGSMICCDAQSGAKKWDKTLNSPVASAALCSQERYVAIDNGIEGFDLYNIQRSSPSLIRRIPVAPGRLPVYYSRAVTFGEGARTLMCGTDHGSISVFELKPVKQIQNLVHEQGRLIQAINAVTTSRKHMIASGVSEGRFDICIWVKPDGGRSRQSNGPRISCLAILNILLMLCVLWATSDSWLRMIKWASELSAARLSGVSVPSSQHYDVPVQPTSNPMPASELPVALDAETLVQLWRQALAHQFDERVQDIYSVPDGQPRFQRGDHDAAPDPPDRYAPPIDIGNHNEHVPTSHRAAPKIRVKLDERAQNIYSVPDGESRSQAQHPVNTRGDYDAPIPPNQSAPPIDLGDHDELAGLRHPIRDTGTEPASMERGHGVPEQVMGTTTSMPGYRYGGGSGGR